MVSLLRGNERGRPKKETTEVKKKRGRPRKKKEEESPFVIADRRNRPEENRPVVKPTVQGAGLDSAMIDKIVEKVLAK